MKKIRSWIQLTCLTAIGAFAQAPITPLPLGASDLAPDSRIEELKRTSAGLDLRQAFQDETNVLLNWSFEVDPVPTELEQLKAANEALKQRVAELEHRLTAVETQLQALASVNDGN